MSTKFSLKQQHVDQIENVDEFLTYILLSYVCTGTTESLVTTPRCLYGSLMKTFDVKKSTINSIAAGLEQLHNKNIIQVVSSGNLYLIDLQELLFKTGDVTITIDSDEIKTILESDIRNKNSLLMFYCKFIGCFLFSKKFNYSQKEWGYRVYCNLALGTLSAKLNVSVATIQKYINSLQNLQLIDIYKFKRYKNSSGEIVTIPNLYCRYHDRKNMTEIAKFIIKTKQTE